MATQELRKKKLEDKLGLNRQDVIKSGFDRETMEIVWDLLNKKYDGLHDHPLIKREPEGTWPNWVYFLVVHNTHASIWAVEEKHLKSTDVVSANYVSPFDVSECLSDDAKVQRYHVVIDDQDRYYVKPDIVNLQGRKPEFDYCLYIGTLTLSLKAMNVIMAMIADKNYLLLQSDCLEYCKHFVCLYFELIDEEMDEEQRQRLEKLTVTTNALSQASERSGRRNPSSGFSLRSFMTSPFVQVYAATIAGGFSLYIMYHIARHFRGQ